MPVRWVPSNLVMVVAATIVEPMWPELGGQLRRARRGDENLVFVMKRLAGARSGYGPLEPEQPECEEESADAQTQWRQRQGRRMRADYGHDEAKDLGSPDRFGQDGTPSEDQAKGQHDGERLNHLHCAGQERCRNRECDTHGGSVCSECYSKPCVCG